MKGKTCCVTGHRDLPQNEINKIKTALAHEIDAAVTDGFTCFMSGFADGVDQYFAELVLERKQTTPALELIAVIPYRKRLDSLNKKTRTRELLEACADVVVIQEKYLPSVYSHRNRYMVEHSDRVIAVYDGRETGGTAKTMCLPCLPSDCFVPQRTYTDLKRSPLYWTARDILLRQKERPSYSPDGKRWNGFTA